MRASVSKESVVLRQYGSGTQKFVPTKENNVRNVRLPIFLNGHNELNSSIHMFIFQAVWFTSAKGTIMYITTFELDHE